MFCNLTGGKPTKIYIYFKAMSYTDARGGGGNDAESLIGIINSNVYEVQIEMYLIKHESVKQTDRNWGKYGGLVDPRQLQQQVWIQRCQMVQSLKEKNGNPNVNVEHFSYW